MTMVFLLIAISSAALIHGALWGLFGPFPPIVEGFVVAIAGGALIVSVMLELLQPAADKTGLFLLLRVFGLGAVMFTVIDN
jgi:ZIP family zinc transporter